MMSKQEVVNYLMEKFELSEDEALSIVNSVIELGGNIQTLYERANGGGWNALKCYCDSVVMGKTFNIVRRNKDLKHAVVSILGAGIAIAIMALIVILG